MVSQKSPADMTESELLEALQEGLTMSPIWELQLAVEMWLELGAPAVEESELLSAYLDIWMKTHQHSTAMMPKEIPMDRYISKNGKMDMEKIQELTDAVVKAREQLVGHIRPAVEGILNGNT